MAYLDKAGLTYFWSKVKAQLGNKSDKGHTHSAGEVSGLPSSLPANGGNADTVDNMHIRKGTSGADGYITFVV